MAQSGFMLSDEGRTITILNDSGTTAITAGDLVYSGINDDVLTGTAASARNAYAGGDIKGYSITASATGYQTILGVALEDIPADGYGAIAMDGVFIHATNANIEAGGLVQGDEAAAYKVDALDVATTTVGADSVRDQKGRALTGGSADGKFIIWKLSL